MNKLLLLTIFLLLASINVQARRTQCNDQNWAYANEYFDDAITYEKKFARSYKKTCVWDISGTTSREMCRIFLKKRRELKDVKYNLIEFETNYTQGRDKWYGLHKSCSGTNSDTAYDNYSIMIDNHKNDLKKAIEVMEECEMDVAQVLEEENCSDY